MRRWIWSVALVIAALAGPWLSRPGLPPPGFALAHPWDWAAHAAGLTLLSAALELGWRNQGSRTPVYRRHLTIFLLVGLFAASFELHPARLQHLGAAIAWLADLAGDALGLVLTSLPWLCSRRLQSMGWRRGTARRPEPGAPLILVDDPHWSGALTGLDQALADHPGADWLFLGDVFDVWVGIPGMDTPLETEFLAWVEARRRAGRWVGLWLGNREFFLDPLADRFDLMGEGTGGRLPAEGLAWEHGDLVNSADWRYRLWNLAARSSPVWLLARILPKATARALAERLQKLLHTTNRAYKLAFPRQAFRAAAAEYPSATFITGHFHTHEVEGNGIALPWAHNGEFALWQDGKVRILP